MTYADKMAPQGVLIDANNMLARIFYALEYKGNQPVTEGLLARSFLAQIRSLLSCLGTINPVPFIVWDGKNSKDHRLKLHPTYKDGRKSPAPVLQDTRLALIEELGIVSPRLAIMQDDAEADDLIAILASLENPCGWVVCTRDADMLSLISDSVVYYNVHTKETWDSTKFVDKYGIPPHLFVLYKAMVGDKSDNWPGIPGVGDKTARRLLSFEPDTTLPEALDHVCSQLKDPNKLERLRTGVLICSIPLRHKARKQKWDPYIAEMLSVGKLSGWDQLHQRFDILQPERAQFRVGQLS